MEMLNTVYVKTNDILDRKVAGEAFLIPVRGKLADLQRIFALNPVAEFIWSQVDGRRPLAEIATTVVEEFDVDEATAHKDIAPFIATLLEANLIANVARHERT